LDFANAGFSGCRVLFDGAVFSDGRVSFTRAAFSGGWVSFTDATFSGGQVELDAATGTVPIGLVPGDGSPLPTGLNLPEAWYPSGQ